MKRDSLLASFGLVPKRNGHTTCVKAAPRRGTLIAAMCMFMLVVRCEHTHAETCGDADGNDQVTVTDGVNVLRAAAGLSGDCPLSACDIDGSGTITVTDGVNVLRAAAGLQANLSCAVSDLIIDKIVDDGLFGELTKIPGFLTEPPAAAQTVQSVAFENSFVSGKTNTITIAYDIGGALARAAAADLSLIVASALEDGTPSPGFFELPITSEKNTVTLGLNLRQDLDVQTFRLKIANGSGGIPIGQIVTIFIVILRETPPKCGNRVLDGAESCDPPGSTCALGSDLGFCNDACICKVVPGPRPTSVIPPSVCQNGIREPGEQCDQQQSSACGGQTCRGDCTCNPAPTPQQTSTPPPTLTVTPTVTPTPLPRFVDNGDGTMTDNQTGLQWEKKTTAVGSGVNLADPHDVDNQYTWCLDTNVDLSCDNVQTTAGPQDGPLFTEFLAALNNPPCFAGHCDWRVPTVNRDGFPPELETIVDATQGNCGGGSGACIDPIFGPTFVGGFWSATTYAPDPLRARFVSFNNGTVSHGRKPFVNHVRAVRAGP